MMRPYINGKNCSTLQTSCLMCLTLIVSLQSYFRLKCEPSDLISLSHMVFVLVCRITVI